MKLKTDLVIMGSGMAGISAADAALARGKKVIVFEKKPYRAEQFPTARSHMSAFEKTGHFRTQHFICYMSIRITMQIRL